MNNIKARKRIKLDHTGQYYASGHSEKNTLTFSLTVHLKEEVNPEVLEQAVNDLMKRLPHFNVRLRSGFLWFYHELLATPVKIVKQCVSFIPQSHFKKDETLTQVFYGKHYFTIEILHCICDGRGLTKVITALLVRYYELLGDEIDKQGVIDCTTTTRIEETEDAYVRYADLRKTKNEKIKREVYVPNYQTDAPQTIIQSFELDLLKAKAKSYDVTITEYIMAHIMNEFAKQRKKDRHQGTIVVGTPIDCRSFFPTECLRNFNSGKDIIMPETSNFPDIVTAVKEQFTEINADFCQETMSVMENLMRLTNLIPLFIKKPIIRKIGEGQAKGVTAMLSSLGLIKIPKEIEGKVDMFSFPIAKNPHMPYQFGCVTVGNTLTLTIVTTAKDNQIIENIGSALVAKEEG